MHSQDLGSTPRRPRCDTRGSRSPGGGRRLPWDRGQRQTGDKQDPDRSGKRTEAPNGAVDPGEQGAKASEATPRCRRRDARPANECAAVPRATKPIADLCKNATLVTVAPSYAWVSARQVWEFGTVDFSTGSIHIDAYMLGPRRPAPSGETPARSRDVPAIHLQWTVARLRGDHELRHAGLAADAEPCEVDPTRGAGPVGAPAVPDDRLVACHDPGIQEPRHASFCHPVDLEPHGCGLRHI